MRRPCGTCRVSYRSFLFAITSIPSFSISLSRKGLRCWCFRIISTGLSRSSSKYAFRRTTRKNRGHFYIDINIASFVVLVSCNRAKETQGGDAEGVLQFSGMRSDESYVFFSCFHFYYSCIFNTFALAGRKADCAYTQGVTLG